MSYPSPYDFTGAGGESYSTTPTTPLEVDLPQWNTYERHLLQQQQEQQQQLLNPHSHPPTPQTYPTIQLDERGPTASPHPRTVPAPHVVPSQMHIETTASPQLPGRHGHGREGRSGQLNTLNYSRLSPPFFDTAPPTSISPTAPTSSSGLVIKSSRPRNRDAKPYDRPQSALGTGSKTPTVPLRQTQDGSRKHSASHRTVSAGSSRPATAQHPKGTPSPIPSAHEEQPGKSYIIRADVYVDPESKVFTALLELPGVRREEVRVTLSSCVYNGVKQVTVSGRTRDPFSASEGGQGLGKIVRERKYGRFIRTFAVSSDTKLEDVDVSMDDGLLLLRVQNRPDIVNGQVQEVPIR